MMLIVLILLLVLVAFLIFHFNSASNRIESFEKLDKQEPFGLTCDGFCHGN
jgi:hypothetical protein